MKTIAASFLFLCFFSLISSTNAFAQTTDTSCKNVMIANVTNYDLTLTVQPWIELPQVKGFGCVSADGANPGPWRLALMDGNTVVSQAPQNGKALPAINSTTPTSGAFTLRCIQVKGNGSEQPVNTSCPGITLTTQANNSTTTGTLQTPTATVKTNRTTNASVTSSPTLATIRQMPIVPNNLDKEVGGMRVADKLQGSKAQQIIQSTPANLIAAFLEQAQDLNCSELKNPSEQTKTTITTKLASVSPEGGPLTGAIAMTNPKYVKRLEKAFKILSKFQCN